MFQIYIKNKIFKFICIVHFTKHIASKQLCRKYCCKLLCCKQFTFKTHLQINTRELLSYIRFENNGTNTQMCRHAKNMARMQILYKH